MFYHQSNRCVHVTMILFSHRKIRYLNYSLNQREVTDPGRVDPDPDSTSEKNPDSIAGSGSDCQEKPVYPEPTVEKKTGSGSDSRK